MTPKMEQNLGNAMRVAAWKEGHRKKLPKFTHTKTEDERKEDRQLAQERILRELEASATPRSATYICRTTGLGHTLISNCLHTLHGEGRVSPVVQGPTQMWILNRNNT